MVNTQNRNFAAIALLFGFAVPVLPADMPAQDFRSRAKPYLDSALAAGDRFVNLSAASAMPNISSHSLASAFGMNLAVQTEVATAPYPLSLGGISVQVVDSAGTTRLAPLLYLSNTQINYLVPMGTAKGQATVNIVNGTGTLLSSAPLIQTVAPALFTANGDGTGVVAATAYATLIPTDMTGPVTVFRCPSGPGSCVSVPIDVGIDRPVTIILYATGLQGRSSDAAVKLTIGGVDVPIRSISSSNDTMSGAGVDMVVAGLTLNLRGLGEVDVVLSVDGTSSNAAKINIQ